MAGGVGSRFWPASRSTNPKQFLDILGVGKSLLRLTFERFLKLCPAENIFIVTNGRYKDLVKEQLPELTDNQILCEPSRNNTGPCVAYTAFKLQQLNPEANLVIAPSDHVIMDEVSFISTLETALDYTSRNQALLTLGIQPSRPDTGYGYINFTKDLTQAGEHPVHKVIRFTEKPPLEKAEQFLASGDYLWNAGIFIWKVDSVLEAFKQYAPQIHEILGAEKECYNTPSEQAFIDRVYPGTPNISIDYAVMEKAENVFTIPSDFGWSDLGTWASLHAESEKDEHQNVIQGDKVLAIETNNTLIRTNNKKMIVARGLEDYIIVDEGDVLIIWPKSEEQAIKKITQEIAAKFGKDWL